MKKYIAAILLVVPLFVFAHTDGTAHHEVTTNTGLLQQMQQQLSASVTTQSTTSTSLVGSLKARQKQLIELAKQSPATALRFVVPANTRSKQSVEAQKYIEQQGSISGTLEVIHVDDFDNLENSYFTYAVNNGGVKTNVYTVKEISSRSGTRVTLQGYKISTTEFLTDGKSVLLSAMPDVGATGKQRTLVLLVNSVVQPEQALTPKQAEDYINNGQFNKFIKEASYGQAWFEAKAYGWIKLQRTTQKEACGFANISDPEIQNFLSKNGINLANYDRLVFLAPGGGGCSTVGKGDYTGTSGVEFSQAWIGVNAYNSPSSWGTHSFPWSNLDFLLAHELGHSLGLWHANGFDCGSVALGGNCEHVEYGNYYDAMGSGGRYSLQYNGFYKEILGWIKSANIINITQTGRYTIGHLELTSPKMFAKVFNPKISSTQPQFIIESRYATGFDSDITKGSPTKNAGILVMKPVGKESSRLIDTTPSEKDWLEDSADASIKLGQTFVDKAGGFLIGQLVSQTATSTTLDIRVDPPTCIRSGGGIVSDGMSYYVSRGEPWFHNVQFINTDSDFCGASGIELSIELPSGWKLTEKPETLTVKPGEIAYTYFKYTIAANAPLDRTSINFYATNKITGVRTLIGKDEVIVFDKVTVSGITPNPAKINDTVMINSKNHNNNVSEVILKRSDEDLWIYEKLKAVIKDDSIMFTIPATVCVERNADCVQEPTPNGQYVVVVQGYGTTVNVPLSISGGQTSGTATSTIREITIVGEPAHPILDSWGSYNIGWQGTNLSKVNIDLYDFKGMYKQATIATNYEVPFSKTNQAFSYRWRLSRNDIPDDLYTIKITDAINNKVKATSRKIDIQKYKAPVLGNVTKVGTSTLKLIGTGGVESALLAEVMMKVTATTPVVNFIPATTLHVRRIAPVDNELEYSSSDESAKIEPVSGDYVRKTIAGKEVYQITQGKSAVFKVSATLTPTKMFAGQYVAELKTLEALTFDGKYALLTIASDIVTNPVTIVGEKSPFIIGVNNPVKANLPVIIEGVRFSPTENILLANGQQYKLKGAVNNKITFIPSEIGLPVGTYGFQIDSPQGKSNYGWLDIKEPTNAANIFTAVWDLLRDILDF